MQCSSCFTEIFKFFALNFVFQSNSLPAEKLQEIQKAIELFNVGQGPAKSMEEATKRSYQFWDTQPVPKLGMYLCNVEEVFILVLSRVFASMVSKFLVSFSEMSGE